MQFDLVERPDREKFENFKIHDGGGRDTENLKSRHIAGIPTHNR